jgi:outer membrane biosynthesis protein TonB
VSAGERPLLAQLNAKTGRSETSTELQDTQGLKNADVEPSPTANAFPSRQLNTARATRATCSSAWRSDLRRAVARMP